jgi:hypothetical protein
MVQKTGWMWISTGLVCIMIIASYSAAFYYTEYEKYRELYVDTLNNLKEYEPYMFITLLIDYDNGTHMWHNNTLVSRGADLLNATRIVAEVDYMLGQWGPFITHINGVGGDANTFWLYYIWNETSANWDYGLVAADLYVLQEGEILSWVYTRF